MIGQRFPVFRPFSLFQFWLLLLFIFSTTILTVAPPSRAEQAGSSLLPPTPEQIGIPGLLSQAQREDLEKALLELADALANLGNRVNTAEAAVTELGSPRKARIVGGLTWYLEAYHGILPWPSPVDKHQEEVRASLAGGSIPGVRQIASLKIDARLADSGFHLGLRNYGFWGVDGYSTASYGVATFPRDPLSIEELYATFPWRSGDLIIGRQYFTLGPLGLLSDLSPRVDEGLSFPLELVRLDLTAGAPAFRNTLAVGRLNTEYYPNTNYVYRSDEYAALRLEKALGSWTAGFNLLASGFEMEEGASLDLSGLVLNRRLVAEIAGYTRQHGERWGVGGVARWPLWDAPPGKLDLTIGTFPPDFDPHYSAISPGNSMRFLPGHTGYDLLLTRQLPGDWRFSLEHLGLYRRLGDGIPEPVSESEIGISRSLSTALHLSLQYRRFSGDDGTFGRFRTVLSYDF